MKLCPLFDLDTQRRLTVRRNDTMRNARGQPEGKPSADLGRRLCEEVHLPY